MAGNKTQGGRRNFLFQHPRFGRESSPAPESAWKDTVYYLWWDFLRRHDGYRKCCERGGTGRYAKLYRDFGNVHGVSFRVWWRTHGVELFAEPLEFTTPREIDLRQPEGFSLAKQLDPDKVGIWLVPLHMRKGYLIRTFKQYLRKRHIQGAARQRRTSSKALYPVYGTKVVVDSLAKTLAVYDYNKTHPDATHWELAEALRIGAGRRGDDIHSVRLRRQVQTITVSRYLRYAATYIANAGLGVFPKKYPASVT